MALLRFTHPFRLLVLLQVSIFIPVLRADFTLAAPPGALPPDSQWEIYQHDVDERSDRRVAELAASEDGSLSEQLALPTGVYKLKGPDKTELWLAPEEGERLELQPSDQADRDYRVTGSESTSRLQAYDAFRRESLQRLVYPARNKARAAKAEGADRARLAELTDREVDAYAAHLRELNDFVIENVGPTIALYGTSLRWDGDYRLDELQQLVDRFTERYGDTALARSMQERLEVARRLAIGQPAPQLVGPTPDGSTAALSDLEGKVVLVDFWASWCPPCRIENQHYAQLVEQLPPDDFEIFAVGLDEARSTWLQAIRRDHADWVHISDLQGLDSPLADRYGVTALPASFLLDAEGHIVGKNLRGRRLDEAIHRLLKKPVP